MNRTKSLLMALIVGLTTLGAVGGASAWWSPWHGGPWAGGPWGAYPPPYGRYPYYGAYPGYVVPPYYGGRYTPYGGYYNPNAFPPVQPQQSVQGSAQATGKDPDIESAQ